MSSVSEHYDRHLGPVYRWMVGDVLAAVERNRADLQAMGVTPGTTGLAVDLGAGLGLHAIPLAQLGFSVVALDACATLNEELRNDAGSLPVRVINDDLLHFAEYCDGPVDAILCMGDTLTHLGSTEVVGRLLSLVAKALASPGVFMATFRNYAGAELVGTARFIPVRSDETRILTCFLEYEVDHVNVHDLLHEYVDGGWQFRVSRYPKVRLDPLWVVQQLEAAGLSVQCDTIAGGMVRVLARRS